MFEDILDKPAAAATKPFADIMDPASPKGYAGASPAALPFGDIVDQPAQAAAAPVATPTPTTATLTQASAGTPQGGPTAQVLTINPPPANLPEANGTVTINGAPVGGKATLPGMTTGEQAEALKTAMLDPLIHEIPRAESEGTGVTGAVKGAAAGAFNVIGGAANFVQSPLGVGTLATAGIGEIGHKIIQGAFVLDMAKGMKDAALDLAMNWNKLDTAQRWQRGVELFGSAWMARNISRGVVKGTPLAKTPPPALDHANTALDPRTAPAGTVRVEAGPAPEGLLPLTPDAEAAVREMSASGEARMDNRPPAGVMPPAEPRRLELPPDETLSAPRPGETPANTQAAPAGEAVSPPSEQAAPPPVPIDPGAASSATAPRKLVLPDDAPPPRHAPQVQQHLDAVTKEADRLSQQFGQFTLDVKHSSDLTAAERAELPDAMGTLKENADGTIHVTVIGDRLKVGEVERVILHEVAGHAGLRVALGDKFDSVLDSIHDSIAKGKPGALSEALAERATRYKLDMTTPEGRRLATEELLARMAETAPKGAKESSIFQRVAQALRTALRTIGLRGKWSDADIHQLLQQARHAVEEPAAAPARTFSFSAYKSGTGHTPLLDFIVEQGGISPKGSVRNPRGEYDAQPRVSELGGFANVLFSGSKKGGRNTPDQLAQEAFEARLLPAPDYNLFWEGVNNQIKAYRTWRENGGVNAEEQRAVFEQEQAQKAQLAELAASGLPKTDQRFQADAQIKPTAKAQPVNVDDLSVGATVTVNGEKLKVRSIDPDTNEVELGDGRRYGVQKVAAGEIIYAEKVKPPKGKAGPLPFDDILDPEGTPNTEHRTSNIENQPAAEQTFALKDGRTDAEVAAEREAARQQQALADRTAAPLKTGTGDIRTPDMFDKTASDTALFSMDWKNNPKGGSMAVPGAEWVAKHTQLAADVAAAGGDKRARLEALKVADGVAQSMGRFKAGFLNGATKDDMARLKDGAMGQAARLTNQAANEVNNALTRAVNPVFSLKADKSLWGSFKNPMDLAQSALGAVREAGHNLDELHRMREVLWLATPPEGLSKPRTAKWNTMRQKELNAIKFAEQHWDKLVPVADRYAAATDAQVAFENINGVKTPYRQNYVMHDTDIIGADQETPHFRMAREHSTLADKIAAGEIPTSLNAVDLLRARLQAGNRIVMNRQWIENLKGMTDPVTGRTIVADMEKSEIDLKPVTQWVDDGAGKQVPVVPPGYRRTSIVNADGERVPYLVREETTAPEGYKVVEFGGRKLAVAEGFDKFFRALTEPSAAAHSPAFEGMLQVAQGGKHMMLVFDTFHLGRLAYLAAGMTRRPPSYHKGLVLTEYSIPEIREMVARGELTKGYLDYAQQHKDIAAALIRNGLNSIRVEDNLHTEMTQAVPGVGPFNRWLFNEYQRGSMMNAAIWRFRAERENFPQMTPDQLAKRVVKDVNTRMGSLGNQSVITSKTMRDALRVIGLAPSWNEGLIRSEIGALKQIPRSVVESVQQRKLIVGGLLGTAGNLFVLGILGNQIVNMLTRGHSTFQNPEDDWESKFAAFVPDPTQPNRGRMLSPFTLPFETTHIIIKNLERNHEMTSTFARLSKATGQYLGSRESYLARPLSTWLTGRDAWGVAIREDKLLGEVLKDAVPAPISGAAIVNLVREVAERAKAKQAGQPYDATRQEHPGEYLSKALASIGLKTSAAPTAMGQVYKLAGEFTKAQPGYRASPMDHSDYADVTRLINIGNWKEANAHLDELLKVKTEEQIIGHYERLAGNPVTHHQKNVQDQRNATEFEHAFIQSLSPSGKALYVKGVEEREATQAAFRKLIIMRETGKLR